MFEVSCSHVPLVCRAPSTAHEWARHYILTARTGELMKAPHSNFALVLFCLSLCLEVLTVREMFRRFYSSPREPGERMRRASPSHGENRGWSPLGSASKIKGLVFENVIVSRLCPSRVLPGRVA